MKNEKGFIDIMKEKMICVYKLIREKVYLEGILSVMMPNYIKHVLEKIIIKILLVGITHEERIIFQPEIKFVPPYKFRFAKITNVFEIFNCEEVV